MDRDHSLIRRSRGALAAAGAAAFLLAGMMQAGTAHAGIVAGVTAAR